MAEDVKCSCEVHRGLKFQQYISTPGFVWHAKIDMSESLIWKSSARKEIFFYFILFILHFLTENMMLAKQVWTLAKGNC